MVAAGGRGRGQRGRRLSADRLPQLRVRLHVGVVRRAYNLRELHPSVPSSIDTILLHDPRGRCCHRCCRPCRARRLQLSSLDDRCAARQGGRGTRLHVLTEVQGCSHRDDIRGHGHHLAVAFLHHHPLGDGQSLRHAAGHEEEAEDPRVPHHPEPTTCPEELSGAAGRQVPSHRLHDFRYLAQSGSPAPAEDAGGRVPAAQSLGVPGPHAAEAVRVHLLLQLLRQPRHLPVLGSELSVEVLIHVLPEVAVCVQVLLR